MFKLMAPSSKEKALVPEILLHLLLLSLSGISYLGNGKKHLIFYKHHCRFHRTKISNKTIKKAAMLTTIKKRKKNQSGTGNSCYHEEERIPLGHNLHHKVNITQ